MFVPSMAYFLFGGEAFIALIQNIQSIERPPGPLVKRCIQIARDNDMRCQPGRQGNCIISLTLRKEGLGETTSSQTSLFLRQARATPGPGGEKKGSWRACSPPNLPHGRCLRKVSYIILATYNLQSAIWRYNSATSDSKE